MNQVVKTFKTPVGEFTALKGIDARFDEGEFVSVLGRSGSGKSTLVNMLTGIDHPTSGTVRIGDTFVHTLNESQMARWRGRNLGIVFQFYQLLPMLSLLDNVMLPMDLCGTYTPAKREARAKALLDMVGLADVAHQMPAAVSGGQQQGAAIARALANDPPIIVADEPTGKLDSRAAETVFEVLKELARQGKTIITVTHDSSLAKHASRSLLLADGQVINETVAATLPLLSHRQMLEATNHLSPKRFAPGEPIIRQGEANDDFFMIAKGQVDVVIEPDAGEVMTVARLGPGQHFGEVDMFHPGRAVASVRAGPQEPVVVVALGRARFNGLMDEAQAMREKVAQVARERKAENAAFRSAARRRKRRLRAQTSLA